MVKSTIITFPLTIAVWTWQHKYAFKKLDYHCCFTLLENATTFFTANKTQQKTWIYCADMLPL